MWNAERKGDTMRWAGDKERGRGERKVEGERKWEEDEDLRGIKGM